jgi:iron complex outermembrane receptor protein
MTMRLNLSTQKTTYALPSSRYLPSARYAFLLLPLALGLITPDTQASRSLEEVYVTAQKVEESLQDVPISISVVGGEELSALSVFDFAETAQLTPGINLFPGAQTSAIRLRGVGPAAYALTSPQSVAVFIDDIAQGSVGAAFATLVDIAQIELLRGPQGTLYGQNAPGGAYNIRTRTPRTDVMEGYLEASYGQQNSSDLESIDIRGAINIPLIDDRAAVRISGVYADSDGYVKVKNPVNPEKSSGGKEHEALRARFLFQPNEDIDLLWTINYQDLTDNGLDFNVDGVVPGTGGANPVPAVISSFTSSEYYADFNSESHTEITDTNFQLQWDAPWSNIYLMGSFQDFKTFNLDNRTPFPGFNDRFEIQLDWETTTAELRFSDTGDTFDYIAGIYYAKRELDGFFDVDLSGTNLLGPAGGAADINAIFGNITYHIADKWDLTTGARYDKNEIWTLSNFEFLGLNAIVDDDVSFDNVSWSIKLRHYLNADTTAYLAVDNAYKQGGFNNLVPGFFALAPIFPEYIPFAEEMLMFDEETSTAFEIGVKGNALEGSLSYSLALFYQEFEDHQITQPVGVVALDTPLGDLNSLLANQLTNAEEVMTKGIEMELNYLFGDTWDAVWRVSYFDATIEDWSFRLCEGGEEISPDQLFCPVSGGEPLNTLPQWNSNAQLGNIWSLTPTLFLYGRLNWSWQSSANYTTATSDFNDAISTFGLSVGLQSESTGLDVRLWGKNLTDEDYNIAPTLRTDGDPSFDQPFTGRYYPGRQYGLTLNYSF